MSSDLKKIISTSGINFFFRIFGLATSFIAIVLIPKLFGIDAYGSYSIIFTISQAAAMLFALGIPNALIKIIGNHNLDIIQAKKVLVKGLKVTFIAALIPSLVFLFGADFISREIFGKPDLAHYLLIGTIALPLFIFHELFLYFLIATKNFIRYNVLMFVLPNALLIGFLFLFHSMGYPGYYSFIAFVLGIVLVVALEAILILEIRPKKGESVLSSSELIKTASPMMFSGLMIYLLNWTDVIILGMMMDERDVGIYNIAFKAGSVGFLVIVSVNLITMPRMAELYGQGDLAGLRKLVHSSTRLIAVLSLPLALGLIFLAPFILSFFGPEAAAGSTSMILVASGVLFSAVCGTVDQILNMSNNAVIFRNITIACFFLNLILNYLLIPRYGIDGSAVASLITNVFVNLACVIYIKKKLGFYTLF